jgi:protein CpxP
MCPSAQTFCSGNKNIDVESGAPKMLGVPWFKLTRRQAMNQRKFQFTYAAARAVAAAAIIATIAFAAAPVIAATGSDEARVEAHIKDMHAKLKVTAAEEDQWAKVAEVMRDNGKKMDELTNARMANAKTMNAVDDLKSYGEIADAHADGIKRFAAAFATLYASMSDAQKAEADALFQHGVRQKASHKSAQKK